MWLFRVIQSKIKYQLRAISIHIHITFHIINNVLKGKEGNIMERIAEEVRLLEIKIFSTICTYIYCYFLVCLISILCLYLYYMCIYILLIKIKIEGCPAGVDISADIFADFFAAFSAASSLAAFSAILPIFLAFAASAAAFSPAHPSSCCKNDKFSRKFITLGNYIR